MFGVVPPVEAKGLLAVTLVIVPAGCASTYALLAASVLDDGEVKPCILPLPLKVISSTKDIPLPCTSRSPDNVVVAPPVCVTELVNVVAPENVLSPATV